MKSMELKPTHEFLNQTLNQTKTAITKIFDKIDNLDRALYGRRMKLFLWGCLLVLIASPIFDSLLGVDNDRLTYYSTLLFTIFILLMLLAFIGSWRDDSGNWSIARAKSRLNTYYESIKDTIQTTRTTSQSENIFTIGQILFIGSIIWKALQNISVFIRKPIEAFAHSRLTSLRHFEQFTNQYYWLPMIIGFGILLYLGYKDPEILKRLQIAIRQFFGWKNNSQTKYSSVIAKTENIRTKDFVLNAGSDQQINTLIAGSQSVLFCDFLRALQSWSPKAHRSEYMFTDKLYRHLRKMLPEATVELEFPIGDIENGNKGRADIVVNETILIEMKRGSNAGQIQRAKGQISQYSEIWSNRGPVILLLCDFDYEHAKTAFSSTMADLSKLQRPVFTIVAKPNEKIIQSTRGKHSISDVPLC